MFDMKAVFNKKRILTVGVVFILTLSSFLAFSGATCVLSGQECPQQKEDERIMASFDLSDRQDFWTGSADAHFENDRVLVTFRRTPIFPMLETRHFGIENIKRIEYIHSRPIFEPFDESFRQFAAVILKEASRENIVAAIEELEQLPFIKRAEPEYIDLHEEERRNIDRPPSTDRYFHHDRVQIILRARFSQITEICLSYFQRASDIEFTLIRDSWTAIEGVNIILEKATRQLLSIRLKHPSRENVLRAIADLSKMTITHIVLPSYIYYIIPIY